MRPGGRIIGRIDGSQLLDQALPKTCRLLGGKNGFWGTPGRFPAIPRRALRSRSVPVRLAAVIGSGRLLDSRLG